MLQPFPFAAMDSARRNLGLMLDAAGLGPAQTPSRPVAELPGAILKVFNAKPAAPALLILPAPFKRPYLWDLLPQVSVVRAALARGLTVYRVDWRRPSVLDEWLGLAEYADLAPAAAADLIGVECGAAPFVAGHSLGGTLGAIFAALNPDRLRGLVLVDAPLAFGERGGPLAAAVAAMPEARTLRAFAGAPVPGTFLNALCIGADPQDFIAERLADFMLSLTDPLAAAIHARVARWTLDEFPLPGTLFEEVLEHLYRQDRFLAGTLPVGRRTAALSELRAPTLAVTNAASALVPPCSILAGLRASNAASAESLTYPGDRGPLLQHLGPLVAPYAHTHLWPAIFDWMEAQRDG